MIHKNNFLEYLAGSKLNTGYTFDFTEHLIPSVHDLEGKAQFILSLCEGKKVLHVGCMDHPGEMQRKIEGGSHLHMQLNEVAADLVGTDIDISEFERLFALGLEKSKLVRFDIEVLSSESFEITLIPDVLEHVKNVAEFLSSLRTLNTQRILITVPNAYSLQNRLFLRKEIINSDHRQLYSPYSLIKTLTDAGFQFENLYLIDAVGRRNPVKWILLKLFPIFREHLCVLVK